MISSLRPRSFGCSAGVRHPAAVRTAQHHRLPRQAGGRRWAIQAIQKVNAEELEVEIANRDRAMIIDFYATWCGPCVVMQSELEKVQDILGEEVRILKVDVDENKELASSLQVEGLPTVVLIPAIEGKEGLRTEGVLDAQKIIELLSEM